MLPLQHHVEWICCPGAAGLGFLFKPGLVLFLPLRCARSHKLKVVQMLLVSIPAETERSTKISYTLAMSTRVAFIMLLMMTVTMLMMVFMLMMVMARMATMLVILLDHGDDDDGQGDDDDDHDHDLVIIMIMMMLTTLLMVMRMLMRMVMMRMIVTPMASTTDVFVLSFVCTTCAISCCVLYCCRFFDLLLQL